MNKHTNFKIGGNADVYVVAKNVQDIEKVISIAKENEVKLNVIGNGSNILVADNGIRGITLKVSLDKFEISKEQNYAKVTLQAGVLLGTLAQNLLKEGIAGFEFAAGIPGSIGGAIYMNAGAYGSEMKDIVTSVTYLQNGKIKKLSNEECNFSYRSSYFSSNSGIILEAELKLPYGNKEEINNKMQEYMASRRLTQPIELPSAGSTFKRGKDFITAKLIDECGLKGYTSGKAGVSTKHAGFVVNLGGATAKDVLDVIEHVKKEVFEKTGNKIELEIELLGDF